MVETIHHRAEAAMSESSTIFVGLDQHKESIAVERSDEKAKSRDFVTGHFYP